MEPSNKTLPVAAIKHGTVIDHIAAGAALKIIQLLRLPGDSRQVTIGLNLPSKSLGLKDLLKVEGRELTPSEVNQVAILTPKATINIIKNYTVVKKFAIAIPDIIASVIVCPNTTCITNHEPMATKFFVINQKKSVKLRCSYCQKQYSEAEIKRYRV